jgi:cell volume regulation protein A
MILAVAVALVIRPLLVGLCLIPSGLPRNQAAFVLFAGLKGAVPILLGSFILLAPVADAERLYGIVVVVVVFSVVVQGSLAPVVARWLKVPVRVIEPQPWALGVRLQTEPDGVHRFTVAAGSRADGRSIQDLTEVSDEAWVSLIVRAGRLVPVRPTTRLKAGDDVVIFAGPETRAELVRAFGFEEAEGPATGSVAAWGSSARRRPSRRRTADGTPDS